MTIIKYGNKEKADRILKQVRRFDCLICGCIFDCNREEYCMEGGQLDETPTAVCPTCGQMVGRSMPVRKVTPK